MTYLALGLGKTVVDGKKNLRFCPKYPKLIHQFYSIKSTIESSQHEFYALDMNNGKNPIQKGETHNLRLYDLETAEIVLAILGNKVSRISMTLEQLDSFYHLLRILPVNYCFSNYLCNEATFWYHECQVRLLLKIMG